MWRCFSLAFQIPVALDFVGFERSCNAIKDNGTLFSIFLKQIVLAWF